MPGFWIAYESVRDQLKEVTRLILDENPGVSVYITGHSMGGALAVLAAYDLAVNFSIKVNMYNFGGPRVGNQAFVSTTIAACLRAIALLWTAISCRDGRNLYVLHDCLSVVFDEALMLIVRVIGDGKQWGLYQHIGTEISLDVAGNLIVDPSFVERHLHHSSRRKTTMHGTNVYRVSIAKCLENLTTS